MARMSSPTPDPSSSSAPPAIGPVLREMQRRHKLAVAVARASSSAASSSSSTATEVACGARRAGAMTVLVETNDRARGAGVEEDRNVAGAKNAAVAIFVADPGGDDVTEHAVSSKTMRTGHRNQRESLSETYDMSDDDDDEISLPVEEANSTTAMAALSVAAAARVPRSRTSRGVGTTDTATAITKRRRRIIAAYVVLSAFLICFLGLGLAQTRRRGIGGDNQSVIGSTGGISSMVPSIVPSIKPSVSPSDVPSSSSSPTTNPSDSPSLFPTTMPSSSPTIVPSSNTSTSHAPTSFVPGDLSITNTDLSISMSSGLSAKEITRTGQFADYGDGSSSSQRFHGMMDGAGIVPLPAGEYAYVSNSEMESGGGGVYGLYFDKYGAVINYTTLLSNTTRNCGGGLTPWGTWVSCEEVEGGQCWQIDPDPSGLFHERPQETLLGGNDGGMYESVTCDNRDPDRPIFFTTEDDVSGALRRFEADGNGWDSLHQGGTTTYLRILDESTYEWTTNEEDARSSAASYYGNSEGIVYHEGLLYFVAKTSSTLFILDLQYMTYDAEQTGSQFEGMGGFNAQPDQIVLGNYKEWIYFTEDGGDRPGVYVRSSDGTYQTIFEAVDGAYVDDETVGVALSPDRRRLYAGFQDAGLLMEFTRDDGLPFL